MFVLFVQVTRSGERLPAELKGVADMFIKEELAKILIS
jgi:hypothetical protein